VKRTAILAAALVAVASTINAQDAQPRPNLAAVRDQLRMMEGLLTQAVKTGGLSVGRRLQASEPASYFVAGDARARGFILDGYGIFFDVEVPMMRQSMVWSMRTLLLGEQRKEMEDLRHIIANTPDGATRRQAEARLRQLERGATSMGASPVAQSAPPGMATATTVSETAPAPGTSGDPSDPNELYTNAVKNALIDAMLDYSGLDIAPDHWLTVAARDSEGPLVPNALDETSTIVLRLKGSDLLAFRTKKISRDEAHKKVEVREF
jgi:hypothetical protein